MKYNYFSTLALVVLLGSQLARALEVVSAAEWRTATDVVAFQPFAEISGPVTYAGSGAQVRLVNLNKYVNSWYLFEVQTVGRAKSLSRYNVENPLPLLQSISLEANGQILVTSKKGAEICDLLGKGADSLAASSGKDPYMPLCGGRLYLRNKTNGRKDAISWVTTGLRDIFGDTGDSAVNFVKEQVYEGAFFEGGNEIHTAEAQAVDQGGPEAALMNDTIEIGNHGIGIELDSAPKGGLTAGQWYKAKNFDNVFVSVMKAKFVADNIIKSYRDRVQTLDTARAGGERDALVDSVAIDISHYTFGWNNGTEHPGVGWSARAQSQNGPGPDGFDTLAPLTFPGVVNPMQVSDTVAVMAGGFQRLHSAFRSGPLSGSNRSHHYGFMEKGVVMSTIVPNLATFIVYLDGSIELKTWTLADNLRLPSMRDIRQNGVPLIETNALGEGIPGALVKDWDGGNWSGSAAKQLKTPRTSACIAERNGKRFLIISYFSTHTPNAMARVLQSYQCKYAIHLDMNHPRFAYSAFFTASKAGDFKIEHLSNSMVDDVRVNGKIAPRSLLTPTYKDFFYVMKK